MNYLPQSRKSIAVIAAFMGAILVLAFTAPPVVANAGPTTTKSISSSKSGQLFNETALLITNGSVLYNLIGTGGNDTFNFIGGNASTTFLGTGLLNNNFSILTGNPMTGTNSSTFSLISGANSTFDIIQNNFNGSVSFSIIAGPNSFVNDTSTGPVANTLFSINLGTNSTTNLNANFTGTETTINVVY